MHLLHRDVAHALHGSMEWFVQPISGMPIRRHDLDLMCRYLSEAVEAYRHNLTLAAATMIGCSYELALVQLATAVVKKWPPGAVATVTGRLKDAAQRHAAGEYAAAGTLAEAVFKSLEANSGVLGIDEWRWVASCFNQTFFIVRELRNDAGRPSGNVVVRDEVFSHIVNLGPTYRHVRAIIAMCATAPTAL